MSDLKVLPTYPFIQRIVLKPLSWYVLSMVLESGCIISLSVIALKLISYFQEISGLCLGLILEIAEGLGQDM